MQALIWVSVTLIAAAGVRWTAGRFSVPRARQLVHAQGDPVTRTAPFVLPMLIVLIVTFASDWTEARRTTFLVLGRLVRRRNPRDARGSPRGRPCGLVRLRFLSKSGLREAFGSSQ